MSKNKNPQALLCYFTGIMLHYCKLLTWTQILQDLFVITLWSFTKVALPLLDCTVLSAKRSCIPSQPLCYWKPELLLATVNIPNFIHSYSYFSLWFLSKIITTNGKTSWPPRDPFIFLFCQEMLMFKGNMFLVLFSFIKITVAEVLQRHRFLKLWRSLKSFPSNTLKNIEF